MYNHKIIQLKFSSSKALHFYGQGSIHINKYVGCLDCDTLKIFTKHLLNHSMVKTVFSAISSIYTIIIINSGTVGIQNQVPVCTYLHHLIVRTFRGFHWLYQEEYILRSSETISINSRKKSDMQNMSWGVVFNMQYD